MTIYPDAGTVFQYFKDSGPSWLVVNQTTGALSGTPLSANVGENRWVVKVNDNGNPIRSGFATLVIKVN